MEATAPAPVAVEALSPDGLASALPALATLLHAAVHAGASINFVMPFAEDDAARFWTDKVMPGVRAGTRTVLLARAGGTVAGTVQIDRDTPPNQPHRAEIAKLIVHPALRRRGIARTLMAEAEARALAAGRTLLTLDTRTGDMAEPLYASLGFVTVGVIPGYCRDPFEDRLDSTTIMYKRLTAPQPPGQVSDSR